MRVLGVDHVVLRVADVKRSLAWYTAVLGLEPERVDEWSRGEAAFPSVRVTADTVIDLVEEERTGENMAHLCFVLNDVSIEDLLASGRFDVVEGPDQRWGARGTGTALYVRDPDENIIELRVYQ